jgi:membrane associated rhomboid family serine protease
MSVLDNLLQTYKQGSAYIKLIYLNILVFLLIQLFIITTRLFNIDGEFIVNLLALPADPQQILRKPWTIISYMFLHRDFFHILFNMLALYWFGKLFQIYFTEKQLTALYFIGGIIAGLLYVVAYNIFPYFSEINDISILMGASGSILAIVVATAMQAPNLEMRMLLIGAVKLKYIAAGAVLLSFFGITSHNAGGDIAHLGGALYGYFFVVSLRRGRDNTSLFNKFSDIIANFFKPRKLKVKYGSASGKKMSDAEFNMKKAATMAEIDRILDKIKASGYGSLTEDEKKKLFEQGKK